MVLKIFFEKAVLFLEFAHSHLKLILLIGNLFFFVLSLLGQVALFSQIFLDLVHLSHNFSLLVLFLLNFFFVILDLLSSLIQLDLYLILRSDRFNQIILSPQQLFL